MRSLRRRLLVALVSAVVASTLGMALLVYRMAREEIDALSDYHLRQIALSLRDRAPAASALTGGEGDELEVVIQIWGTDGTKLYRSRPDSGLPEEAELGFATLRAGAGDWRVYSAQMAGLTIQVAQPLRVRQQQAAAAALRTLAPVILMLPLLAGVIWRIVGRALAPLDRLAHQVASRTPAALEPIGESGAPEEAIPLVRALNDLLVRLDAALVARRAFVADAAHELRTPLAALELQAQLVERAAEGAERATALADLRAGLARMTRVVQQLLTLARAEPDAETAFSGERVRLSDLVAQAVADHALLAEAKGIDLGAGQPVGDTVVMGELTALRTLLANLVDNAIRFSPPGGRVDVDTGTRAGHPYLEVSDRGPGIPLVDRERVFRRFYRRGGSTATGSGLGLAIVKAIADRHSAIVELGDAQGGGLKVSVDFPFQGTPPGQRAKQPNGVGSP